VASFAHDSATVSFRCPPVRPGHGLAFVQPDLRSAGAVRFGMAAVADSDLLELRLRLTDSERAGLVHFFASAARGIANEFVYEDAAGDGYRVRFASPVLPAIVERACNAHAATARLRVLGRVTASDGFLFGDGSAVQFEDGATVQGG
jgi:hypothetical protein